MDMLTLIAMLVNICIFISVLELIRRNRLKEKYSLLWIFSCLILLAFSVSRDLLHYISYAIGIKYPPSLLFILGLLFLIVINVHFTTVLSELSDKNKVLSQEIALLKEILSIENRSEE